VFSVNNIVDDGAAKDEASTAEQTTKESDDNKESQTWSSARSNFCSEKENVTPIVHDSTTVQF
jgi:hypothetical protein